MAKHGTKTLNPKLNLTLNLKRNDLTIKSKKKLLSEKVKSLIKRLTHAKTLWVAYSGGIDSHVLLHIVVDNFLNKSLLRDSKTPPKNQYKVCALHIHHGLSPNADKWVNHCENVCAKLEVPLTVLYVDAQVKEDESPEEAARRARFAAWENFLQKDECLLLGHHESDQAETILLRLFRGAGPTGLGGMGMKSEIGKTEIVRPLLETAKEDILQYAKENNLKWIEDESNQNRRFDRNFLRQEILPLLQARWPRVIRSVNRSGSLCLETATAMQVLAEKDFQCIKEMATTTLSVKKLLSLEPRRRKAVIRLWLQTQGFLLPSRDHTERIDREILQAKSGSKPRLKISDYEVRRIKDNLIVDHC